VRRFSDRVIVISVHGTLGFSWTDVWRLTHDCIIPTFRRLGPEGNGFVQPSILHLQQCISAACLFYRSSRLLIDCSIIWVNLDVIYHFAWIWMWDFLSSLTVKKARHVHVYRLWCDCSSVAWMKWYPLPVPGSQSLDLCILYFGVHEASSKFLLEDGVLCIWLFALASFSQLESILIHITINALTHAYLMTLLWAYDSRWPLFTILTHVYLMTL
jgi:hypothetical protein